MMTGDDPRLANEAAYGSAGSPVEDGYLADRAAERDAQLRSAALETALRLAVHGSDHMPLGVLSAAGLFYGFLKGDPDV